MEFLEESAIAHPERTRALIATWTREIYAGLPGIPGPGSGPVFGSRGCDTGGGSSSGDDDQEAQDRAYRMRVFGGEVVAGADFESSVNDGIGGDDLLIPDSSRSPSPEILTAPVSPQNPPSNAVRTLTRNETILYLDSGNQNQSLSTTRRALRSESTVRAFTPTLSPSAVTVLSASDTPAITSNDESEDHDPNTIAERIEAISMETASEASASARGRTVTGTRGKRGVQVVAEKRTNRTRKARS